MRSATNILRALLILRAVSSRKIQAGLGSTVERWGGLKRSRYNFGVFIGRNAVTAVRVQAERCRRVGRHFRLARNPVRRTNCFSDRFSCPFPGARARIEGNTTPGNASVSSGFLLPLFSVPWPAEPSGSLIRWSFFRPRPEKVKGGSPRRGKGSRCRWYS